MNNEDIHNMYMEKNKNYEELLRHVYKKIPNANFELVMRCKKNYDKNIELFVGEDWNSIIIKCMKT